MKRNSIRETNFGRLLILVFSIALVFYSLRTYLIISVTTFECWSIGDVWFSQPILFSPLAMYALAFSLLGIWAVIESYISIKLYASKSNLAISSYCIFSIGLIFFGLFHFWQYIQIERGLLTEDDYLVKLVHFRRIEELPSAVALPSFREYVYEQRCGNGLAISNITTEEWKALLASYDALAEKAFSNPTNLTQ